jgi:hypothetical protein
MTNSTSQQTAPASTLHNIQLNTRVLRSQACRKRLASDQIQTVFGRYMAGWGGLAILILWGISLGTPEPPPPPLVPGMQAVLGCLTAQLMFKSQEHFASLA